jgi:hypothetical protein
MFLILLRSLTAFRAQYTVLYACELKITFTEKTLGLFMVLDHPGIP